MRISPLINYQNRVAAKQTKYVNNCSNSINNLNFTALHSRNSYDMSICDTLDKIIANGKEGNPQSEIDIVMNYFHQMVQSEFLNTFYRGDNNINRHMENKNFDKLKDTCDSLKKLCKINPGFYTKKVADMLNSPRYGEKFPLDFAVDKKDYKSFRYILDTLCEICPPDSIENCALIHQAILTDTKNGSVYNKLKANSESHMVAYLNKILENYTPKNEDDKRKMDIAIITRHYGTSPLFALHARNNNFADMQAIITKLKELCPPDTQEGRKLLLNTLSVDYNVCWGTKNPYHLCANAGNSQGLKLITDTLFELYPQDHPDRMKLFNSLFFDKKGDYPEVLHTAAHVNADSVINIINAMKEVYSGSEEGDRIIFDALTKKFEDYKYPTVLTAAIEKIGDKEAIKSILKAMRATSHTKEDDAVIMEAIKQIIKLENANEILSELFIE